MYRLNVLFGYHIIVGNLRPVTLVLSEVKEMQPCMGFQRHHIYVFYENINDLKCVLPGYIFCDQ